MSRNMVKCLLHGDYSVGKTTLCIRHCKGEFPETYLPTVFEGNKDIVVGDTPLTLRYFELQRPGERFWPRTYLYCCDVCVFCFSLVNPTSYEKIMEEYYIHFAEWRFDVPIILVGTKRDLIKDTETLQKLRAQNEAPLTTADGARLAESINAECYLECSSLTGEGVDRVFHEACLAALSKVKERKCSMM